MTKNFANKIIACLALVFAALLVSPLAVQARIGDMGFFGGVSQGRPLLHTTEEELLQQGNGRGGRQRQDVLTVGYQELVFLSGRPVQVNGTMRIVNTAPAHIFNRSSNIPVSADDSIMANTFTKHYIVEPSVMTADDASITRNMVFNVRYRVSGNQVIYTYSIVRASWSETIVTPDGVFTLDNISSQIGISVIEDRTPGVNYYRGNLWARLYFVGPGGEVVIVEHEGYFHGFYSAWAATETHRTNVNIWNGDWALQYQIRPSVTVNKTMNWSQNEPSAISFVGNFQEIGQTFAGLRYDIFEPVPHFMWDEPRYGGLNLQHHNSFEQLPAPNLDFLRGNAAYNDIHRLFAMEVLTGNPRLFVPNQVITRGQFMSALARAIRLPTTPPPNVSQRNINLGRLPASRFTDVNVLHPEFRYIEAIYTEGVAYGRTDGSFHFYHAITRQEAIATIVRALGLEIMAPYDTVAAPFADSDRIADWAIREMVVAEQLGLITPDARGNINPTSSLSKGQAAALLNSLIDYMRTGLALDYADQIVNIAR